MRTVAIPFRETAAMGAEAIQGRDTKGVPGAPWGITGSPLSPLIPMLKWGQSAQIVTPAPPARPAHEQSTNVYATFTIQKGAPMGAMWTQGGAKGLPGSPGYPFAGSPLGPQASPGTNGREGRTKDGPKTDQKQKTPTDQSRTNRRIGAGNLSDQRRTNQGTNRGHSRTNHVFCRDQSRTNQDQSGTNHGKRRTNQGPIRENHGPIREKDGPKTDQRRAKDGPKTDQSGPITAQA